MRLSEEVWNKTERLDRYLGDWIRSFKLAVEQLFNSISGMHGYRTSQKKY
jgi:hypothetical protein